MCRTYMCLVDTHYLIIIKRTLSLSNILASNNPEINPHNDGIKIFLVPMYSIFPWRYGNINV